MEFTNFWSFVAISRRRSFEKSPTHADVVYVCPSHSPSLRVRMML